MSLTAKLTVLPGMDGTSALRAAFVAALRSNVDAHVVSYPMDRPLNYAQLTDLARSALPVDKPFFLLGESFSGPIAIALAAQQPNNLRGLILCASFAANPRPELGWLRALVNLLPIHPAPSSWVLRYLFGPDSTPGHQVALAQTLRQIERQVLRARLRAVLSINVSDAWRSLSLPTLYIRATHDRLVPHRATTQLIAQRPAMQCVVMDASHFVLQTAPRAAADVVRAFCDDVLSQPDAIIGSKRA